MPNNQKDEATELLRDILIVQLALAGVGRDDIRKLARCGTDHVVMVLRTLKSAKKGNKD